jgi:redox-sensitive bicupin YhaK (pirin superfamily)
MGNVHLIRAGEVQVMSAGTGVTHSEYNGSDTEPVNFLQVWVMPKLRGIAPRYGQRAFDPAQRRNRLQFVVAPNGTGDALSLNQDAWFALADIDAGAVLSYALHDRGNGVYLFVVDGVVDSAGERLSKRDGMGVSDVEAVDIAAVAAATVLVMEVPMH